MWCSKLKRSDCTKISYFLRNGGNKNIINTCNRAQGEFMKFDSNNRIAERGFSLIELMIVIAIIGILIAVGVTGWKAAVKSANEAAAVKTLRTIAEQQMLYYNSHQRSSF